MTAPMPPQRDESVARLLAVMASLRAPASGCPWDLQQNFNSIAPFTIEEAYEVADAVARGDMADLRDELGDLLFNVVYHARLAEEAGAFDFHDVAAASAEKMVRRHPHVFAASEGAAPPQLSAVHQSWEQIKAAEKQGGKSADQSALSDVPANLPALSRAAKILRRAAKAAPFHDDAGSLLDKIREETGELADELALNGGETNARAEEELGDLLLSTAHLAAFLRIDPETALRAALQKFTRRFQYCEAIMQKRQMHFKDLNSKEINQLWDEAKRAAALK